MSDKIKRGKSTHPTQPKKIIKDGKNEVTCRVILVVDDKEVREGVRTINHHVIRVVQWSSNQSCGGELIPSPVTLEKRRVHICKDGSIRNRKAMGFTLNDLKIIAEHWAEILEALQK